MLLTENKVEYRTAYIHANDKWNRVNKEEENKHMKEAQPQKLSGRWNLKRDAHQDVNIFLVWK